MSEPTTRELALLRALALRTAAARTVDEVCAASARVLGDAAEEVPFALLYVAGGAASAARTLSLVLAVGVERGGPCAPETIALDTNSPWPVAKATRARELVLVEDLAALGSSLPATRAVALPLPVAGGYGGVLVVGLRAGRALDDDYRGFLLLLGNQLAASLAPALVDDVARVTRDLEQEHRDRLNRLFAHAPVAFALLKGPHHEFELINAACDAILNHRAVVGKTVSDCFPELASQGFIELLDRVYATGEPLVINDLFLHLDRDGDGVPEDTLFSLVYQPLLDKEGRVEGMLGVGIDLTPQLEARRAIQDREERLRVALDREQAARNDAERANRTKDEFLAMLGHELRNPLAPISTALHLMRLRGNAGAERERSVIERQVNYLVRLVDDLLDVSRITRGKVDLKREQIEMSEVVAKAIETASPLLEERQHRLTVSVPRAGLLVEVDPTRMSQVISNLLTNAAKYTEPGGSISVSAARESGEVVARVRDTGIGIAADMLPRVFELFTQEQQALDRSHGGLGLGLAIVHSLVAMHGGRVDAFSEGRGRGSELIVRLPAAEGALAEEARAPSSRSAQRPQRERRVLVVDDNIDAAEMLAEALEELGCATAVAHDGPSALRVAEEFRPDVALLDIGLPVMDGYELARRLRELPSLARVRLVAVTGYGQDADRRRSAVAGFDSHLVKPINLEAIEAAVNDAAMR